MRNNKLHFNQLRLGSILSYLQMALSIILGLVYTPIMIRLLGQSEYGLYNTVSSTISTLSILNLGFNSGYIRYYSIYKKKEDNNSIYKLNGLFLSIFIAIGFVALACGLYLTFHLQIVFDKGLTEAEYSTAKVLMLLLTLNLAISFPMSVFSNIISAHERFVFLKLLGMIKTVVSPLVTLPLLLMGYRSIAMVAVTVVLSILTDILYMYYVFAVLKNRFIFKEFEKGIIKQLFSYTAFIAINSIIDQINWNIDKLLLGRFKGTSAVAVYSVGYSLFSYYMLFSTSVSGVFTPRIHLLVETYKQNVEVLRSKLTEVFVKVGRIQFILLSFIASGVVFFGKFFIEHIWAGKEYSDSYYIALLLIIPGLISLSQNMGIEIQRAQNKHKFRSTVYLIMAIINLFLSIYLCQIFGAVGSAFGTAISIIVANVIIMNIYYDKACNIKIKVFWKNIVHLLVSMCIPLIFGFAIYHFVVIDSNVKFFVFIILYSAVYGISLWAFGLNDYEKEFFRSPVMKLTSKIKRG